MKKLTRHLRLALLLLAVQSGGCLSPAGPPAPPAEIPALVQFPESVGIDVSQAGSDAAALKTQAATTDFSDIISLGPIVFNGLNLLLDDFLGPLSSLEIPVSPTVATFEGPITFAPGIVAQVMIDFADFDLDGDGTLEGCAGCTCPTGCAPAFTACPSEAAPERLKPVCYRIWLRDVGQTEFNRFAAGLFDRYATRDDPATESDEENAGRGVFRLGVETPPASDGSLNPLAFGVIYDHKDDADPLRKETEFFVRDRTLDADGAERERTDAHAVVVQEAPTVPAAAGTLRKTVKLDFRETPDPEDGPGLSQYIGRFLDDFDFWSGTFRLQDVAGEDPKTVSGENVCARLSSGAESSQANCIDLGIDVTGEAFLRASEVADTDFPADFPEAPTF
jgi:hypothetical protein